MIKILIKKQSNYPVSVPVLKKKLSEFFTQKGIVSDAICYVSIIGEEKMKQLGKKFLKENGEAHNVLSFTESEAKGKFVYPPGSGIHLGEIIICYPIVFQEARDEAKMIDDKVYELVEHGALHLLGEHHD